MSIFERFRPLLPLGASIETCRRRAGAKGAVRGFMRAAMLAAATLHCTAVHATTPPAWKDTGFSINANGMTLARVLSNFGATYGVRLAMAISGEAAVQGRLQASSGAEFLDRLASTYGFRWFVYNDTLHVVTMNDFASVRLEVGEDTVPDAKAALLGLGLFEDRFGWGELPDEGIVFVSGPRAYVDLVKGILLPEGKKPEYQERQLMVFRLKYASAADRVVTTRGQQEVIPGVKTILSGMLNTDALIKTADTLLTSSRKRSREGKLGPGESRQLGSGSRTLDSGAGSEGGGRPRERDSRTSYDQEGNGTAGREPKARNQAVRIDADPSLNAILIYDRGSKRAMYQTLISEIDIAPQQVEIEALIVDIDRGKLFQLGVEWGGTHGHVEGTINGTSGESKGIDLPLPGSTILIRNSTSFYARLSALEQHGDAQVLAKPTVLTLENVAAVLDLNQSRYVPLVGERVADLANITAGTMLKVVPRVIRENNGIRVRLDIDIEDGAIDAQVQSANTQVTRSTITTQAIVEPQHTLLVGGYHSETRTVSHQKIPLLGDIPVFGALFQNRSDNVSNRERLFLITPRLTWESGKPAPERSRVNIEMDEILSDVPDMDWPSLRTSTSLALPTDFSAGSSN